MLTERTVIGHRDILPDGQIQVRYDTVIDRDGVEISRTYHREVIIPGQNVSLKDSLIRRVAAAEHTPEVIAAYQAAQEAQEAQEAERP